MKLDIVIPTYKRPDKLANAAASIKNCIPGPVLDKCRCFVYFSGEDMDSYLKIKESNVFGFMNHELVVTKPKIVLTEKVNQFFSSPDRKETILCLSDDSILTGQYIADAISYYDSAFPDRDAVLALKSIGLTRDDGVFDKKTNEYSFTMIGAKFLERFGGRGLLCPFYTSYFTDNELEEYAKSVGKWNLFPGDGFIIHDCRNRSGGIRDDGYYNLVRKSRRIYDRRKSLGLLWGKNFTN